MPTSRDVLRLLEGVCRDLDGDLSLESLASRAGWSPFHLHRAFRRTAGETPKRYTQRLRLERAAAELATGDAAVLEIALAAGFGSHEVFTRAFRRHFGRTPTQYGVGARAIPPGHRERHRQAITGAGPCMHLFRMSTDTHRRATVSTSSIERRDIEPRPILFVRRRVARTVIAATTGDCLGKVFAHSQAAGLALAGPPVSRYPEAGPGLITIEVGMPLAAPGAGAGAVEAGSLNGGAVAMAVHVGSYDSLGETYAAIERWIAEQGHRPGGSPWEVYVTDPAEHPDPADWKTEVYWPLAP
jgi:AraC family transcriptional regulator